MWSEANDGGICKDGDEDLRLEKSICSRDFEWLNQTSQTPWQGVEDLIKDHLACAVILQDTKQTCNTETPNNLACCLPEAGLRCERLSSDYDIHTCPSLARGFILKWIHFLYMHQWSHCESAGLCHAPVLKKTLNLNSSPLLVELTQSVVLCAQTLCCADWRTRLMDFHHTENNSVNIRTGWCGSSGWGFAGRPYLNCFLKATCEWHHSDVTHTLGEILLWRLEHLCWHYFRKLLT